VLCCSVTEEALGLRRPHNTREKRPPKHLYVIVVKVAAVELADASPHVKPERDEDVPEGVKRKEHAVFGALGQKELDYPDKDAEGGEGGTEEEHALHLSEMPLRRQAQKGGIEQWGA
jgi:hypothetical protein